MNYLEISVVIPFYNDSFINECINSLLKQDYPRDKYEIIVVDNLSDSTHRSVLEKYKSEILVINEPKKGSYYCRNRGISVSRFDVIAFTDSDCRLDSKWLRIINKFFLKSKENIVALQGNSGVVEDNEIAQAIYEKYKKTFFNYVVSNQEERLCARIDTRNCAIRRKVFQSIGIFNEKMQVWGDAELGQRIVKGGYKIKYVDDMKIYHKNINNIEVLADKRRREGINITKVLEEFGPQYTREYFREMLFVFLGKMNYETEIEEKRKEINYLIDKYKFQLLHESNQNKINEIVFELSDAAFLLGIIEEKLHKKESNCVYKAE